VKLAGKGWRKTGLLEAATAFTGLLLLESNGNADKVGRIAGREERDLFGREPALVNFGSGGGRDVPPVGGFIGLLVLGEIGSNQKKTEQNAIGQFLDVHTLLHGVVFSIYPLTEDPVRW
jgi:hypothetical protein